MEKKNLRNSPGDDSDAQPGVRMTEADDVQILQETFIAKYC